jgi:hypothetical protein
VTHPCRRRRRLTNDENILMVGVEYILQLCGRSKLLSARVVPALVFEGLAIWRDKADGEWPVDSSSGRWAHGARLVADHTRGCRSHPSLLTLSRSRPRVRLAHIYGSGVIRPCESKRLAIDPGFPHRTLRSPRGHSCRWDGRSVPARERLNRDVAISPASSSTQLGSGPKNCQRPSKYTESERPQGTSYVEGTYK